MKLVIVLSLVVLSLLLWAVPSLGFRPWPEDPFLGHFSMDLRPYVDDGKAWDNVRRFNITLGLPNTAEPIDSFIGIGAPYTKDLVYALFQAEDEYDTGCRVFNQKGNELDIITTVDQGFFWIHFREDLPFKKGQYVRISCDRVWLNFLHTYALGTPIDMMVMYNIDHDEIPDEEYAQYFTLPIVDDKNDFPRKVRL